MASPAPLADQTPAVVLENVSKSFGKHMVLDGVSLTISSTTAGVESTAG